MTGSERGRTIAGDWYAGSLPDNLTMAEGAYVETSYSLLRYRSQAVNGVTLGRGAAIYNATMLDMGPAATLKMGDYSMLQGVRVICDSEISIGSHTMLSWLVLLMDSYRMPRSASERRAQLEALAASTERVVEPAVSARPIHIGNNVWIGFGACILPGVSIGDCAVIGAHSVVRDDVPPYSIFAGNPARLVRTISADLPRPLGEKT
jgi:acetyltransferase-like isoleucine patch superfamily enzyme